MVSSILFCLVRRQFRLLCVVYAAGFFVSVSRYKVSLLVSICARFTVNAAELRSKVATTSGRILTGNHERNPAATSATTAINGKYWKWSDTRESARKYMSKKPSTGNKVTAKTPSPNSTARPQLRRNHQQVTKTPHQSKSAR